MTLPGKISPMTGALTAKPPSPAGEAREFLPAALEILETPANPAGRALALLLAAMFVAAICWAVIGKVDVVAVAPGRTVPVGGSKLIQPLELGTVRAIHVSDGQKVTAGQILVELDPTEAEVDLDQLRQQQVEQALEAARLSAYIAVLLGDPQPFDGSGTGASATLRRIHETQLRSDITAFEAERASIEAERSRRLSARASAMAELAKSEEILPILRDREVSTGTLFDKGLTSKPQMQQVQASMIEATHDLDIQRNRLAEADTALVAIERELAYLLADRLRLAYAALTKAETALAQISLALHRAQTRMERQILRAPVTGTVQQLAIHTEGGVVEPARPIMVIVPDNAPLEIRATLQNKDMGRLREGLPVEVKLEAYNFTRYGTLHGRLVSISQDAIEQEGVGLVYDARIRLDSTTIHAEGRDVALAPGMAVTVELKTGRRRIIDFLLSPLYRYSDEAIREP